jgi:hypothetical protein
MYLYNNDKMKVSNILNLAWSNTKPPPHILCLRKINQKIFPDKITAAPTLLGSPGVTRQALLCGAYAPTQRSPPLSSHIISREGALNKINNSPYHASALTLRMGKLSSDFLQPALITQNTQKKWSWGHARALPSSVLKVKPQNPAGVLGEPLKSVSTELWHLSQGVPN